MKRNCYKMVCEKCTNRGATISGLFKEKVRCNIGRKPIKNKCFYFVCEGKTNNHLCESCPNKRKV